jgi:hypothetical protein
MIYRNYPSISMIIIMLYPQLYPSISMITTGIWRIVRNIFEATTGVLALTSFDPAEMVAGLASADEGGDHPDGPSG